MLPPRDVLIRAALSALLIIMISMTACRPSHAAGAVIPAYQPITTYDNLSSFVQLEANGQYKTVAVGSPVTTQPMAQLWSGWFPPSALPTGGNVVNYTPPANATTNNPLGMNAKVSGGVPVLEASIPVHAVPPAGAAVSPALETAALAAAGGAGAAASSGALVKSAPLSAATASMIGKSALGLAGGALAFMSSPYVVGALVAAQVGMAGYEFYKGLNGEGITFNPDGSAVKMTTLAGVESVAPITSELWKIRQSSPYYPSTSYLESCRQYITVAYVPYGYSVGVPLKMSETSYRCAYMSGATTMYADYADKKASPVCPTADPAYTYNATSDACQRPLQAQSVPATEDTLVAAIDALAASNALLRADIAQFGLKQGVPAPAASDLPPTSSGLLLASKFSELGSKIDSLGNTTKTLERTVSTFSPTSPGVPPAIDTHRETVTLVNSTPTAVQTTSLASDIAGAISKSKEKQDSDLCKQHPEILACADITKTGDVPEVELLKRDINVSIVPVNVPGVGVCPAPTVIPGFGLAPSLTISYTPICSFAGMIKPLLLAFAWLSAGMIVFVGRPYSA